MQFLLLITILLVMSVLPLLPLLLRGWSGGSGCDLGVGSRHRS